MKILLIITFFIISGAVRCFDVIGYSGGSVLVNSRKSWFKDCFKHMTKLNPGRKLIYYKKHNKWINERRFTLFCDDKGYFMIYIKNLNPQDSGSYRIGADGQWYTDMTLNVREDSCCGASQSVMVNTGETVIFSCPYSHEYKTHEKIIMKEGTDSIEMMYSTERLSISDERDQNLFSVRMTAVRSEDAGVYLCGVQLDRRSYSYSIITAVHLNIINSCCGASQSVMVNTGETVIFSCPYSHEYKTHEKIIMKEGTDSMEMMYSTERLSISDERDQNLFSVRMTAVRSEDAGVYLCGVQLDRRSYSYSIITAVHLNIMSKVGEVSVTGYSAGGIIIMCHQHQYKSNSKYLCKESDGCCERKYPIVQNEWMINGEVSLYDDTKAGVLIVYFRELNTEDAGTYRCGVNVSHFTERFTEIKLEIKDGRSFTQKVNKSVYLGDEVNITCQIPEEYQISPKFFCKEDENHICQIVSKPEVKLNNISHKSVFTVTISNMTVRDAGIYWCGAETSEQDLTFIYLTIKIHLTLTMPPVFGDEGGSVQIICPYDPVYKSKSKYVCNNESKTNRLTVNDDVTASVFTVNITGLTAEDAGKYCCVVSLQTQLIYLYTRLIIVLKQELILSKSEGDDVSMECNHHAEYQKLFCKAHEPSMCVNDGVSLQSIRHDETSTGVFTVNISDVREEDSGIYWCGSHIITKVHLEVKWSVSVKVIACICVTLPLIGALILLLYKLRFIKTQDNNRPTDRTQRTCGEVSCDYENVKDIRRHLVSDPREAVIYSTVTTPTNLSDPAQLPTIPSDLHSPLYSTVQLPTIPSADLLYAAVSFHKHEDSVCDATVIFSKDEISTDYAAVRRLD